MNTASLELCTKLYLLSGWDANEPYGVEWHRFKNDGSPSDWEARNRKFVYSTNDETIPAYDLSYLLRKLPRDIRIKRDHRYEEEMWVATSMNCEVNDYTPEGAACRICIVLFERGVLKI